MAIPNANTPFGLKGVRKVDGSPFNNSLRVYQIPATNTSAYYLGDPLIKVAANADADGVPAVILATAGTAAKVTGVLAGFVPTSAIIGQTGPQYRSSGAKSTATYVLVDDSPDTLFEIQCNATAAATIVGKNANLVSGSGSPYTGWSGWQLNTSQVATTNTYQVNIVEFVQAPDNSPGQNYAKVLVRLNTDTELSGQAGI